MQDGNVPSSTSARPRLTRARVIAEAVASADADGFETVSMRTVAARLAVVPMALYKHVSDRRDLTTGMIDAVIAGFAPISPGLTGSDAVRARVAAARSALVVHPWFRTAVETAPAPTPGALAHMDAIAADFIAAGLSIDLTHYAMHALGSRIWGFSPEAFATPTPSASPDPDLAQALAARYPYVVAIAADSAVRNPGGACDSDAEFTFTLDLLLDAIERLHEAGWVSRTPSVPAVHTAPPPLSSGA